MRLQKRGRGEHSTSNRLITMFGRKSRAGDGGGGKKKMCEQSSIITNANRIKEKRLIGKEGYGKVGNDRGD